MASEATVPVQAASQAAGCAALQHRSWRSLSGLSSGLRAVAARLEQFLSAAGFERAPWLAVGFASGIGAWFELANSGQWLALVCGFMGGAAAVLVLLSRDGTYPYLREATAWFMLAVAAGCLVVWAKSTLVGTNAIARPYAATITGRVLDRQEQPADQRVRLVLAIREPDTARAIRVRINVPLEHDRAGAVEGAIVRLRARLVPPAPPMLPGGYNFARVAWFDGVAATGSALGPPEVLAPGSSGASIRHVQRWIAAHIHGRIAGSAGGIAAAFASGDRGGIADADEQAMRDAGLTHLLSVSGLHVSAVIAGGYLLTISLLALWPWLTLRVRLPVLAAGVAAMTGINYTLLTGAEVPTVRSCAGALLVLLAVAIGREPLSLRMLAIAALLVMLLWPEAVAGPSFQMSFASVLAIISLHGSAPMRRFLAHRDEGWLMRRGREAVMLLATGMVIELALMPIAFYHFHRAGIYGALANVVAIPLTTFVSMPLIALALFLDLAGLGAPVWWLAGKSLELLLGIAHWTAGQPGAVNYLPAMGEWRFLLFVAGALWLALWRGRVRLLGLIPAVAAALSLMALRPPDLLISGDGRQVGITGETVNSLLVLREARDPVKSSYAIDNLTEGAGTDARTLALADWPGAACNADYCTLVLIRNGHPWHLLIARGAISVPERALAAACDVSDIVIAARWLPQSCHPRWLKADRNMLDKFGGLTIDLSAQHIATVADGEGQHGWWHPVERVPFSRKGRAASPAKAQSEAREAPALTAPSTSIPNLPRAEATATASPQ
ncbi:MAG: ComEC/Rec2 family competence protein [Novosphingobium sp.]